MAMGFNSWLEAGLVAVNRVSLEEYDFRTYSPYGEKELMMMMIVQHKRKFERIITCCGNKSYKGGVSMAFRVFSNKYRIQLILFMKILQGIERKTARLF